jgi:hypothetical protein
MDADPALSNTTEVAEEMRAELAARSAARDKDHLADAIDLLTT